jgi:hypothetical protein
MQLVTSDRQVVTEGVEESTSFGFDAQDLPFIKRILRDSIYSDKHLAPIREYSANAWDAHRMAGKADLPIKVRIPTWDDPRLLIEDYGPGLSHEQVFSTYAKYGRSTKRDTNNAVGMLGIGSKSAFCYSDTFVITSRYGGMKRVYVAKLNMDGNDSLDLLSTSEWTEDTGITIEIAVRREDIKSFETKARELFKYFNPRPDINIDLPPVPKVRSQLKHGLIYEHNQYGVQDATSGKWLALMGCIPYVVDLDQLKDSDGKATVSQVFRKCAGILDFDVGAVQISSSREALEYSKTTKEALAKKFEDLLDEYIKFILDEIEQSCQNNWQKRLKSMRLMYLGMTEDEIGELAKHIVYPKAKTFQFSQGIQVLPDSKLIREIVPEGKDLRGYHLYSDTNILVKPKMVEKFNEALQVMQTVEPVQYYTWPEIDVELEQVLKDNMLDGIPFGSLEDMPWHPPYSKPARVRSPRPSGPREAKHVKRIFKLTGCESYRGKKYSNNWEVLDHAPKPTDVYVIIEAFVPKEMGTTFFDARKRDKVLASTFGVVLPEVYGYKSTEDKPVDTSKIVGIPYSKWRAQWHRELMQSEEVQLAREFFDWKDAPVPRIKNKPKYTELVMAKLAKEFGQDHAVLEYLRKALWAREIYSDDMQEWKKRINALEAEGILHKGYVTEPDRIVRSIIKKYPLMSGNSLSVLWGRMEALHWRQYIRCIDREEKSVQPQLEYNI